MSLDTVRHRWLSAIGCVGAIASIVLLVVCAGCASWPMHQPYEDKPGVGQRPAWLAHGLMGSELNEHDLVSIGFMGEAGQVSAVTIISRQEPDSSGGLELIVHQYRDPSRIEYLDRLWQQRLAAPSLKPMQGNFEGKPCWFILSAMYELTSDKGIDLGWLFTRRLRRPPTPRWQLEWYFQDPHAGFVFPAMIWTAATGDEAFKTSLEYVYVINGRFYTGPRIQRNAQGDPLSVEIVPWSPPPPLQILAGYRVKIDEQSGADLARALNQRLLEWKTKELAEAVPAYGKPQLQDLVVKLESALLDLDSRIKKVKEAQDEAARYLPQPGQAAQAPPQVPQWQVEQSHLFAQRKAIVMACLEIVKKALAQKR